MNDSIVKLVLSIYLKIHNMELIGSIANRKIYYLPIRNNSTWQASMPISDWVVLTIADREDADLVPMVVKACLNSKVSYTCSVGAYAVMTEAYFDEEIVWREVEYERKTKKKFEGISPLTTAHENLEEGFWFAATVANVEPFEISQVVCINLTQKKVKQQLIHLMEKINQGWLPQ